MGFLACDMNSEQALTREPCCRRDVQGHLREMEHELAGVRQNAEAVGAELRTFQRELNHAKQVRARAHSPCMLGLARLHNSWPYSLQLCCHELLKIGPGIRRL